MSVEPEIVAYHERESEDPITGAPGILRKEWRVVSFYSYPIKTALRLFGSHRVHSVSDPKFILERRYIRRGTIEPWEAVDLYESEEAAYNGLDLPHTALSPLYVSLQTEHERLMSEAREQEEKQRQLEYERDEKRRLRARADEAFNRLQTGDSESDKSLCDAWNAFIKSDKARANRETYKNDPRFMFLYTTAYDSYKIPSKRKAIREFLAYVGELPRADTDIDTQTELDLQIFS